MITTYILEDASGKEIAAYTNQTDAESWRDRHLRDGGTTITLRIEASDTMRNQSLFVPYNEGNERKVDKVSRLVREVHQTSDGHFVGMVQYQNEEIEVVQTGHGFWVPTSWAEGRDIGYDPVADWETEKA